MIRLNGSVKFLTVCSTIIFIYAFFESSILIIRRNSLLKEKASKIFLASSSKYKMPPPNYVRYMELWIFHNLALRAHFISDIEDKESRVVSFKIENIFNAEILKDIPFGHAELDDDANLRWTIMIDSQKYGLYSYLDTCAYIRMDYLSVKPNGFYGIFNNKQINVEYQNQEEWQNLLKDDFYCLTEQVKLDDHIFLYGISKTKALIRCETAKGDTFITIKCDQEIIIDY